MAVEKSEKIPRSSSSDDRRFYRFGLRIMADFGAVLAAPAVAGLFLGVGIDRWLGTRPWGLFLCLVLAFVASGVWIRRKVSVYAEEFERLSKK